MDGAFKLMLICLRKDFSEKLFEEMLIWSKISWFFLTAGIVLGSYWAYSELGWGGWWFWDPVENISLIPWLLNTALIHSLKVSIKSNQLKLWSLNLGLYCFIASVFGTFLVRSNLIVSVHSFATDPLRGLFLIIIIGYLLAMTVRLNIKSISNFNEDSFDLFSKESFLLLNIYLYKEFLLGKQIQNRKYKIFRTLENNPGHLAGFFIKLREVEKPQC